MTGNDGAGVGDRLVDGMNLSIRLRRDFTVTDAGRLMAAARRMYQELNPGSSTEDAEAMVSCAADACYVILDHAGLVGDAVDDRLIAYRGDGLDVGGWRAEVVANDPWPLSPGPLSNCVGPGDVFALPPDGFSRGNRTRMGASVGPGDRRLVMIDVREFGSHPEDVNE